MACAPFRGHPVAAPLKPVDDADVVLAGDAFRGHPVAAPLKRRHARTKSGAKRPAFRGHPVAAPLKPCAQDAVERDEAPSAAIRSRPH